MPRYQLEIACFDAASAAIAEQGGADRIELCNGFEAGGTTPSEEMVLTVLQRCRIPVRVMLRPRGGGFVYSDAEFLGMQQSLQRFKAMDVNGFVFGILNGERRIDQARNKLLVELAKPLPCTFHRAFDQVAVPAEALEVLIACGFDTLLTSGPAASAGEGIGVLEQLIRLAAGRITVMPGGGVRSTNVQTLKERLQASFYHSSAITGTGKLADLQEVQQLKRALNA